MKILVHLSNREKVFIYFFIGAICTCYMAYVQMYGAGWTFDDTSALQGLGSVSDFSSAVDFILNGFKGSVTGRPIAMASFLANLPDWPQSPFAFRQINVLLHLLNGLLIFWISYQVARMIPALENRSLGFAVVLSSTWMLHPLLASTSFQLIQRMTLLAATLTLTGVLLYLKGRSLLNTRPVSGYIWMSFGLFIASALGLLAKENAALSPLLIATLEITLLSRFNPVHQQHLKHWRLLFFAVPAAGIILYLTYYTIFNAHEGYQLRRFDLTERLLSEPIVLLEYIKQILLPDILRMGPYQDDMDRIHGLGLFSISATIFWIILIGAAVYYRKQWPAFAFAVLFYLVGHSLESTVLNLELYFEHRNYLPSLGILGGLIGIIWAKGAAWLRNSSFLFPAMLGILLWQLNSLWGDPIRSVETWAEQHPTSPRAMQNLPTLYQRLGYYEKAAEIVNKNYRSNPLDGGFAIYSFATTCFIQDQTAIQNDIHSIITDSPRLFFSPIVAKSLHNIIDLKLADKCDSFNPDDFTRLVEGFLDNPLYNTPDQQYALYFALARTLEIQGDKTLAMDIKLKAYRILPSINASKTIFFELLNSGRNAEAAEFLMEARERQPRYSLQYDNWGNGITGKKH